MAYHEFKCSDFLGKNLQPYDKIYLIGDNTKLAEIYITQGLLLYDYKIVVKNYAKLWFLFEDEEGDQYSLICLLNGTHGTNYNSSAPNMTTIYIKGDELEKYNILKLSTYDVM